MARFVIKRILSAILTLFVVVTMTFFLMNLIPGGPFNTERASKKTIAMMEKKYGLDKPLFEQYLLYLKRLARFDLGDSYKRVGFSVNQIIAEKFPTSARLGVIAIALAVSMGVPMGTVAAFRRNKWLDRVIMFVATLGIAVPNFVMATTLLIVFGVLLGILPTLGLSAWQSYIMPAFALSFYPACFIARLTRSSMLDVLSSDYIKTARAKGLPERRILFKHAMRNAIIPVISYLGPLSAGILTGGFVVEKIFTIPGMGKFFIDSVTNRDYPLIVGVTVFLAALLILMNLIVDLVYGVVDPRINYE
ncbi:ABC transporter permease [Bacillota bacterium Meth-B3]|nr:ABC transporter permease [Christensenellaceae bacterium]MEA5064855.1 ABC transporter permease [Eubacteriales bacterium]